MNDYIYNSTLMAISSYSTLPSTQHLSHIVTCESTYRYGQAVDCYRLCSHNHNLSHQIPMGVHLPTMVMSLIIELSPFLSRTSIQYLYSTRFFSIQSIASQLSKLNEFVRGKWCYLLPLTT